MINARINGTTVSVRKGTTILQASKKIDIDIPSLCNHPDLEPTSACGICIVRVAGLDRLVRACSTIIQEGMEISTHDPDIIKVRRTILELIISGHPTSCLTCSRNGTCELQSLAEAFGIRTETLPSVVKQLEPDSSTGSIVLDPKKCIKCGRCIEVCQVKQNVWALSFLERGLDTRISPAGSISLADSPCIRCGQCSAHCPVGAIHVYSQTAEAWNALSDPDMVCIAQVAPSVRVSLGETFGLPAGVNLSSQIYAALRKMGFQAVFDTNFGADVTVVEEASEFARRYKESPEKLPLITTCCPAWVDFMEKFHGDMIDHFSSCKSPHAIVGVLTKTYYAEKMGIDPSKIFLVSIMPCTAKKYEITRASSMFASGYQDVDLSLTTREFIRMIQQSGIMFSDLEVLDEPDSPLGEYSGAGAIFGVSGGVMEAALRSAHYYITGKDLVQPEIREIRGRDGIRQISVDVNGKTIVAAVAHGLKNVETLINNIREALEAGKEPPYHFVEVMACPDGCIGGGGQAWNMSREVRKERAEGMYKIDSLTEVRCSHRNPSVKKVYAEFLGEPLSPKALELLHTAYTTRATYKR